ncbi:SulP family inorganic anion transporter [Geobacter sp.]|uniref:SulP family inorganic anion transporter n=1 Tax=Geobacter sp. TaxID=46610 RepID=UPI0027BB1F93|nr:SulP family inorganic anion transporter [Geobacter sp.]
MKILGTILPMMNWLPSYQKDWLRYDLVAGLTAAAVVIPKAMAYAAIAGLPLVVGLYTSLVPLVVYAVMGTSRPLSVTSTSTIAILAAGALGQAVPGGDAASLVAASATLALLAGAFLVLAGLLRLGVVANLISDPVLTGFKAGIGVVIVLDQLPKLLGIHITKAGFFRDILSIGRHLPETSLPTLLFALAMLALMLGLEHFAPRVPAPLVTVAIGIAAAYYAGLDRAGIALVGTVQAGLPSFALPNLSLVVHLWPAALGIALMSFVETAAAGRAFIRRGDTLPDANQELVATGMANLAGSLFHIMPAGGGTSQTAVNDGAGARSQVAGLVTAAVVMATLLFLAPLFGMMPHPTLAAVVVIASIGLINPAEFRAIRQIRSMEFRWALIAVAGVLLLGTLKGILVAVLVSLVALIIRANRHPLLVLGRKPGTNVFRPRSPEHPEDETFSGLLMLRPAGAIYFGNAPTLGQKMRGLIDEYTPRVVVLELRAVPDLEFTALRMLTDGEEKLREAGTVLWLVALNPEVLAVVQNSPLGARLGRERMFFTLEQAVDKYQRECR